MQARDENESRYVYNKRICLLLIVLHWCLVRVVWSVTYCNFLSTTRRTLRNSAISTVGFSVELAVPTPVTDARLVVTERI